MPTDVWAKADGTSSEEEEESDDESGAPAATTQEAKSQVLQEIKQVTHQSEAVAAPAQSAEKSEQEKRALEERQRLLEAQKAAQAAQAAAMQQAAASRQAQAEAKARQEAALKQAQEAQAKAQSDAKARHEAAQKQAQDAQAKAQADAKARQEAAQKQAQEAQAKAQADAKARQEAAQKQAQEAQAKAQADAQARAAQAKAQADALAAQRQAAQQQRVAAQQQKTAPQQQAQPQQQQQQQQLGKAPAVKTQELNLGSQATSHAVKQPLKEPGKLAAPAPAKPDAPKEAAQLPGNTALRQTAKAQESSMSDAPLHPVHTAALAGVNAQKPQVKQAGVEERFAEKVEQQPETQRVQRQGLLNGAQKWEQDSAQREEVAQMTLERGPAGIRLQDDTCWQTQKRVAPEIDVPAVGKVTIPEFSDDHEVMRTIVAQPAGFQKVAWNEFPEEKQVERIQAPRVKAQEWKPVNQEEMEVLRTNYNPGRVSAVWPPPQEEIVKDSGAVTRVRVGDDLGWIQQEQHEVPRFSSRTSRINRAWPPPEHEVQTQDVHASHLGPVVWPPPEFEEKEKEVVDSLHNTLPVGHIDRQWPPAAPEYTMVPQRSPVVDTQHGPQEISETVVTTTQVVRQPMAANSLDFGHLETVYD
ncbi:unnamed protein product, partial [Mesorhabditis spiculigera]